MINSNLDAWTTGKSVVRLAVAREGLDDDHAAATAATTPLPSAASSTRFRRM
jgi:hypothetical protein